MNSRTPEPIMADSTSLSGHARTTDTFHALPVRIQREVTELTRAWEIVGKAMQDGSHHCEGCPRCKERNESERYGDGWVFQTFTECSLGEYGSDTPSMCPAYLAHLEDTKEEA